MARYPVSGQSTQDVPISTGAATGCGVLAITSGRVFWLRGVKLVSDASFRTTLDLYDATTIATSTSTPAVRVALNVVDATGTISPTSIHNFSPPGIKFSNQYVLAKTQATMVCIAGEGGLNVWGYEE